MKRFPDAACTVLGAAIVAGACGVDNQGDEDGTEDEPIVVAGGYPLAFDDLAALAAADWYWAGDARTFFAAAGPVVPVAPGDDGAETPTDALAVPGEVVRAFALGASLCPDRVTITPMTTATPCGPEGDPETIRGGASLVFDQCDLPSGTRLGGTVEITSMHTTDDPTCDDDTVVTVDYATSYRDFSWVTPAGVRVLIPELRHSGRFSHRPGTPPSMISVGGEGRIQRFLATGDLDRDVQVATDREIEILPDAAGTVTSGMAMVEDRIEGVTVEWTSEDVRREPGCCRPVDGRLVVRVTDGPGVPEGGDAGGTTEVWELGPTCGTALRDGEPDLLPGCP